MAKDIEIHHRHHGVEGALGITRKRSGSSLDPQLVDLFRAQANAIVEVADVPSVWEAVLADEPGPHRRISPDGIDAAAEAMADFSDLKSDYLAGHSRRVAGLAEAAGAQMKGATDSPGLLRLAGLVHDLGRVAVSAAVWDKPAPLSDPEWERVRLHP